MKSGTFFIDFDTRFNELLNSSGGEEKLSIAFQSAWNAYTYDNMDVFYIDVEKLILTTQTTTILNTSTYRVSLSNGDNVSYLNNNFNTREDVNSTLEFLDGIREEIKRQLEGHNEIEKIRQVHNWLIDNIEYDTSFESDDPYSIYGTLIERKAVCEGYARSFKYILDELGIPCVLVSGTGTNSNGETESHAWNYVEIAGKWYAVDVTWDDPIILGNGYISEDVRYRNFLKGSESFFTNHYEDGELSVNSMEFDYPELSENDYNV